MSDATLALTGRVISWLLKLVGVKLPSSDYLFGNNVVEIGLQIQAAMDAKGPDGRRAGWAGGLAVLDKLRKQAALLFLLPEWLVIAIFMSLPGSLTPKTSSSARQQLQTLRAQHAQLADPKYLFKQVVAEVSRQLARIDTAGSMFTKGVLQKIFELRRDMTPPLGWRAREAIVLAAFRQYPEYAKFLSVTADGSPALPSGTTYEEFAASMLANAYGPYPI